MPRKRCNRCRQFGLSFGRGIWQITVTLTDITWYSFLFSQSSSFLFYILANDAGKWRYYLAARSRPISFWFAVKASSRVCNTRKTAIRLRNIVWKIRLYLSKKEIETSNAPLLEKWSISLSRIFRASYEILRKSIFLSNFALRLLSERTKKQSLFYSIITYIHSKK